jgi:integrase
MRRNKSGLPKHCGWNTDRHGKRRVRFRKGGFSTYLVGIPWSDDFMRAYASALEGVVAAKATIGASRTPAGSVAWLVAAYLDSSPFKMLADETRRTRRNILDNFRAAHGALPLFSTASNGTRTMLLTRQHVQVMVNQKAGTPFAQRNLLNTLRVAFQWAVDEGRLPDDPTLGVKRPKTKTDGYRTWSEDEIARFEACHPIGTKARLAFDLLLNTGQRRGDVVRMGPQHLQASADWPQGLLVFNQGKTKTPLVIPVHPQLRESIDATPSGHLSFLVTHQGQPYVAAGFGNWFREQCDAAGCPDVSAHGLRKATATRLADLRCSEDLIKSILGHTSSAVLQVYTRKANRGLLAIEAMRRLVEAGK